MSAMPQSTAIVWVGTRNTNCSAVPLDAAFFVTNPLGGLPALTINGARQMCKDWGSKLSEDALSDVWVATCGVPRLLEYAFGHKGELSSKQALSMVQRDVLMGYRTATECVSVLDTKDLTNVVLSSCVAWETSVGHRGSGGREVLVPGCKRTTWETLKHHALVFPAANRNGIASNVVIPRYFFNDKIAAMNQCCPPGVKIELLYPDLEVILSSRGGARAAGVPYEQLIACSLATRFYVHCLAHGLPLNSYIRLVDLYPSQGQHVTSVLEPYDVCLQDGVDYPIDVVFANDFLTTDKAVIANVQQVSAHHDILLPVVRRSDRTKVFIAIQCRYDHKKGASELKEQMFVRKGSTTEVEVLLQCCPSLKVSNSSTELKPEA